MNSLKLTGAIIETIFAIPVLGASIIIGCLWIPMVLAFVFHIVTLILSKKQKNVGPIMGILANSVGFIPFVGWVLHILAAIFLWVEAVEE